MVAFFGVTAPTASGRPRTRYVKVTTGIGYYVWLTSRFTLSLLLSKRKQPRPQCLSTLAVGEDSAMQPPQRHGAWQTALDPEVEKIR